jgi:hypothetical protein
MPNPFDPRAPVKAMENFVGRTEDVENILSGIRQAPPLSYAVVGGRHVGKTSLLNYLVQQIEGENRSASHLTIVPVELRLRQTTPGSRWAFFNPLLVELTKSLNTHHHLGLEPQAFTLPPSNEPNFDLNGVSTSLKHLIHQAMTGLGHIRFVFLIDEFEVLVNKPFTDDLIGNLRHLISYDDARRNLSFVFFGDKYLYEIATINGSPLAGVVTNVQLGPFTESESLQLIHQTAESQLAEDLARQVVQRSNGHPCILQHLMWRLAQSDLAKAQASDLEQACADFIGRTSVFRNWMSHFDALDKRVYHAFAKDETQDIVSLTAKTLRPMFPTEAEKLPDSLNRLAYHGLLCKITQDEYLAPLGLFAEWFRARFTEVEAEDEPNRGDLLRSLNGLPSPQLNEIIFEIDPPAGVIPSPPAPQGNRTFALLEWAEGTGGCGLSRVQEVLNRILKTR